MFNCRYSRIPLIASLLVIIALCIPLSAQAGGFLSGFSQSFMEVGTEIMNDPYNVHKQKYNHANKKLVAVEEIVKKQALVAQEIETHKKNLTALMREYNAAK